MWLLCDSCGSHAILPTSVYSHAFLPMWFLCDFYMVRMWFPCDVNVMHMWSLCDVHANSTLFGCDFEIMQI